MMRVFVSPQRSRSWYQSRLLRASRETSRPMTAPTCPRLTSATSRWKPGRGGGSRFPEIVVDHDDLTPAQAAGVVLQVVLAAPTLVMVTDLGQRRLTDVDERGTVQMLGANLFVTDHRGPPRCRCGGRPAAAGRPAARRGDPGGRAAGRATEAERGRRDPAVPCVPRARAALASMRLTRVERRRSASPRG